MRQGGLRYPAAAVLACAVLAGACGQKPDVHVGFPSGGSSVAAPATHAAAPFSDADGDGLDDASGLSAQQVMEAVDSTPRSAADSAAVSGSSAGSSRGAGADTAAQDGQERPAEAAQDPAADPQGPSSGASGAGNSTGVTDTTVKIGMHAPITGAAPLPASSFQIGRDQYWRAGNKVAGRTVEVLFRDDKYNPSSASQVCQELIHREKVFILVGTGGTDQMAECARVAHAAGVPYLSPGATEVRLDELAHYFSVSMSYGRQMPLLMQFIVSKVKPANGKVALIASNTANFDDAVTAYEAAARRAGLTPVVYRPSKQASDGELAGLAQRMTADQVSVATPVIAPTQWIRLASNPQLRTVKWHGIGVTMGLNTVAAAVCQSSGGSADGSTFFSPWPGLNMADDIDAAFNAKGGGGDDIQWSLWGLNKTLHAAFNKIDGVPTREAFAAAMTGLVRSGIFPDLDHTTKDHFRALQVHQLRLDCASRQFVSTRATLFRDRF